MTNTTSVPQPTFGATGFVAPSESDILAGVQQDTNAAFGGDLNPALTTPQGQLASSITAILGYVNDLFLYLTNMFDPALSTGRYQDALARIYFIERNPSQPTIVQVACLGLPNVVIPTGQIVIDQSGAQLLCTAQGTIGSNGTVTLPFAYVIPGPTAVPASLTIYSSVPGWDTATVVSGIVGQNVETRSAFEQRRALAVAQNSLGSIPSVLGAVLTVPNVVDAFVTENAASAYNTIGGVQLAPNSLYVAVVGGEAAAVAQAIWSRKAPGCAYNGNTSVTVQDTNSGYSPPYPSYLVSFEVPANLSIFFSIVIVNSAQVPSNAATLIQNAIIGAFGGLDGGPRARIGTEVLASRYYAPIATLGTWAQIVSVEIGTSAGATNLFKVPVNINQIPAIAPGNISVSFT